MNLLDKESLRSRFINYLADSGSSLAQASKDIDLCLPVVQRFYKGDSKKDCPLRTLQKFHLFLKAKGF